MATLLYVPWYATVFRGDSLEEALDEIAPVALRYGATDYSVYRLNDDRYRFIQMATFERKSDIDVYWHGPEFSDWRADYSSWYQVPVVYTSSTLVASGRVGPEANGHEASSSIQA
jgi:hypothetical protein